MVYNKKTETNSGGRRKNAYVEKPNPIYEIITKVVNSVVKICWCKELWLLFELIAVVIISVPDLMLSMYRIFVPLPMKSIRDKLVLITGSASGIGRELAIQMSKLGATIICVDRDASGNCETLELINKISNCGHSAYTCDVSNSDMVDNLRRTLIQKYKDVPDIIINNVVLIRSHGICDEEDDFFKKSLSVNVLSYFWIIRNFLPPMIERKSGHIVAMSSMAGTFGLENLTAYCTSKFAITGLMNSLQEELRLKNQTYIKLTCVQPYFINTNPVYSKNLDLRISPLNTEEAVGDIINGIRRELFCFSVPSYAYYAALFTKVIPEAMFTRFRNVVWCRIRIDKNFNEKLQAVKNGEEVIMDDYTRRVIDTEIHTSV